MNIQNSSCEDVSLYIMQELGTTDYLITNIGALNSDLELWVGLNTEIDRMPRYGYDEAEYDQNSIYAPKLKFFGLWPKAVDPTINIGGVYFGIDKLSHFLGSGYEYFKVYLGEKENGALDYKAKFSAINWGLKMENTIIGIWSVGIFSYADLEANYQGFLMAKDFCDKSILLYNESEWKVIKNIKIQNYINPSWDEAYNPNSYTKEREKKIRKNIVQLGKCEKMNWKKYNQRFALYKNRTLNDNNISEFDNLSLSNAIITMLKTKNIIVRKKIYNKIIQHYNIKWSYEGFSKYFNVLDQNNEALTLEMYCNDKVDIFK